VAEHSAAVVEAIAQRLLDELASYERQLLDRSSSGWNTKVLLDLAEQAEIVSRCAQCLPRVGVSHTEFVITRTDLTRALHALDPARLEGAYDAHLGAVKALGRAGQRLMNCS
jgi:hypothetical protein